MSVPTQFQALWDEIPDAGCKGLCAESCGPIGASPVELALLAERGIHIEDPADSLFDIIAGREVKDCPALVDGKCSAYKIRPTVCRMWGSVEDMPCPHGCVPEGGLLPSNVAGRILRRSMQIGQIGSRAQRRHR